MKSKIISFLLSLLPFWAFPQLNIDSLNSNNAFRVGEKLVYAVKYGLIKGGEASLVLDIYKGANESYYYHAKATAVTTGMVSSFAKIYDIYESYFDLFTGLPVWAIRNIRENNYTYYNQVFFYQDSGYIYSVNRGIVRTNSHILDILSAFYFARKFLFNRPLEKNQIIYLPTYFEDKFFPLKIKFKERETVKTKFGKIRCLKFVPVLEQNNPFKKEDDLQIWFSDDRNFIPVKIRMKSKFGVVKADLIYFENLNNPLAIKHK